MGHFGDPNPTNPRTSGLNEALWLLGTHQRAGKTRLLSTIDELSTPLSTFILTGHAVSQKDLSDLERVARGVSKLLAPGGTIIFTGLCPPNFTGTVLRETIQKHSGYLVDKDIQLCYAPLYWGGESLQTFKEKPKLIAALSEKDLSNAQETLLAIFPTITSSQKVNAVESAGLFGPVVRDVMRALEFELATLCESDNVDYAEVLELSRRISPEQIAMPHTFDGRDAIASNIAIGGAGHGGRMSIVRAARRINETGEERVLDLMKNALSLCGKRFRNSRISVLGFNGLGSPRETKPSLPRIIRTLEKRGAVLSVYPGRDRRWFEDGVLTGHLRVEDSPLRAASRSSCALIALDPVDFGEVSPQKLASEMSRPAVICDLSRVLEASNVERAGLFYASIGRGNTAT